MFEQTHAYVDGELDELEKIRFEREMARNPALAEEVEKLRALKNLVRETYGAQSTRRKARSEPSPEKKRSSMIRVAAVWILGVAVGGLLGWQLERVEGVPAGLSAQFAAQSHVILHIDQDDPDKLKQLLADARTLAAHGTKVTMVANAEAVKLFSVQYSPAPQAITQLAKQYENVQLVVCKRALRNMARRGIRLTPLTPAKTDIYALDYIVQGVERGWKYQKI